MEALIQIFGAFAAVVAALLVFYWQSRRDRRAAESAREEAEDTAKTERDTAFRLLQQDHNNLKEQVGGLKTELKADIKANGDNIEQLLAGQGKLQGSFDTVLEFIKTATTQGVAAKSADEPVGAQPSR